MIHKALITGGSGFIGSHLADELVEKEIGVRILDNLSSEVHGYTGNRPEYLSSDDEVIHGDIRSPELMRRSPSLVHALLLAHQNIESPAARAFHRGGGTSNTIRLIKFIRKIEMMQGCNMEILRDRWRQGDQRYFVSDTTLFRKATGWRPLVSLDQGLQKIHQWLKENIKPIVIRQSTPVGYEIRPD